MKKGTIFPGEFLKEAGKIETPLRTRQRTSPRDLPEGDRQKMGGNHAHILPARLAVQPL